MHFRGVKIGILKLYCFQPLKMIAFDFNSNLNNTDPDEM